MAKAIKRLSMSYRLQARTRDLITVPGVDGQRLAWRMVEDNPQ